MDLAKRYMATVDDGWAREVYATIGGIKETLRAEVKLDFMGDEEQRLSIYVGAMSKESFSKILGATEAGESAIIVGDRRAIQKKSAEAGVSLIIISGGFEVDEEIIETARKNKVSLIVSPFDSATTALLVRMSTPAERVCCKSFNMAQPDELVEDLSYRLSNSNGMLILDEDGKILGIITKSNILKPSKTRLILVDHNELSQAVDGAEGVSIVGVVDHHRIGNFNSSQAIPFICDPVGATSTLVSELYKQSGKQISKKTAGLLLGGVLSDTVILKSPTTTDRDRDIVSWLEEKSGLSHLKFGE
ncbi:MAG: CBS domain-containing protein, partial [bacterium]|nr:CBS domain-containing protein [bacterium]